MLSSGEQRKQGPKLEETCEPSAPPTLGLILATALPEGQEGTEHNVGRAGDQGRQTSFSVRINTKRSTSFGLGN